MSGIVMIQTEVRDPAARQRLGLAEPVPGATRLYSGPVIGLTVRLPEWRYPIVADLASGTLHGRYYVARHSFVLR